jgi:uncharacterized protein YuzE
MKTTYDPHSNALTVRLTDAEIRESEEVRPGIVFDYDKDGRIVGFEILDATTNLSEGFQPSSDPRFLAG